MTALLHPSLLWLGLPLVGVPILIHLINMMRHRRVRWAAMEFLLVSQKRHRTWIVFKQLLLLLLRMVAVAAIVLMVAQPLVRNQWGAMFGGSKTHHIVLLDDSFSMSDRWADTSAFEEARQVIDRLATHISHEETPQIFSLLRFSRAAQSARGVQPDLLERPLDADFAGQLKATLAALQPSESAAGPAEALEAIDRMPAKPDDENRVVYLVSDFRAKEWDDPAALKKVLGRLDQAGAQLRLVQCVDTARANLGIVALRPGAGTRAAGVPLMMEVAVKNFGSAVAREVSVQLEEDGSARPAVVVEEIPPGKTVSRRFPVLFTTAGQHQLSARLESDTVAADNSRYVVIDFPAAVPVLIIDGDSKGQDAYFVVAALSPGGKINSGLKPQIESPRYLRDHELAGFSSIFLLNIERLDPGEIEALEKYAKAGGGIGFFMGELARGEFFNKNLYRDGEGLFPLPLTQATQMLVDRLDKAPDLEVTDHPIFAIFSGERNSFISTVVVDRYFAAPKDWAPAADSSTKVIARLRNGAPLAVEQKYGEGRVVAILTKAAPVNTTQGPWNNWGRNNPSFVVALLEMQSYLSAAKPLDVSRLVGAPLDVVIDPTKFQPQVRFVLPQDKLGGTLTVDAARESGTQANHEKPASEPPANEPPASDNSATPATELTAELSDTDASGIYEAQLTTANGASESERFAYNVAPDEGDLRTLDSEQLAARLSGLRYQFHKARDLNYETQQLAGFNLGESLMYLLLALLVGEQILAYSMSYHPAKTSGRLAPVEGLAHEHTLGGHGEPRDL